MKKFSSFWSWIPMILAGAWLAACGDPTTEEPRQVEILSFHADPEKVSAGAETTIAWSTRHATRIALSRNGEALDLAGAPTERGSLVVSIDETSVFELEAFGASGERKTATVSVKVDGAPGEKDATIVAFSADPTLLSKGQTTTISWETTNAVEFSLSRDGVPVPVGAESAEEGAVEVQIDETSVFTLEVKGETGPAATRSVEVEALGVPAIGSFSAPEVVSSDEGGMAVVTLSWTGVENADELLLGADTGETITLDFSASGSVDVEIEEDTVFTLVARNALSEVRSDAEVRVVGLPVVSRFFALPSRVGAGEPFEVHWETEGAVRVELLVNGLRDQELDPSLTTGSTLVTVALDSEIELRATNEGGGISRAFTQVVVGAPQILSFVPSKESLWVGETLGVSWSVSGGTGMQVAVRGVGVICQFQEPSEIMESSCDWQITEPGLYEVSVRVWNAAGEDNEVLVIAAGEGALIVGFSVTPSLLDLGGEVTATWSVLPDPDGAEPTLELMDGEGETYAIQQGAEGAFTFVPQSVGALELILTATTSSPLSVPTTARAVATVHGFPEVNLVASPSYFDDLEDDAVALSWTSEHAASVVLMDMTSGSAVALHTAGEEELASGSFAVQPTETSQYRVVATSATGSAAGANVTVDVAPTEILSFTSSSPEVVAGEPVLLEWTARTVKEISLDIFDTYVREERQEPFLDLPTMGGTHLPLTECGVAATNGCELLDFPQGFAFPFEGIDRTEARVYGNGVISFNVAHTTTSTSSNAAFPTSSSYQWVHLAPFWDALGWKEDHPQGNIYTLHRQDPAGDSLVIQWKDIGFSGHRGASLNFEVVLWENGDFEYRYGTMERATATVGWERGTAASIGYQFPGQVSSNTINYNTSVSVRDVLDGRTFAYRVPPTLSNVGSFLWYPYTVGDDISATLTVVGNDTISDTLEIAVVRRPILKVVQAPPSDVEVGESFRIAWETQYGLEVEIEDALGNVLCEERAGRAVEAGFCQLSEPVQGDVRYTVRAIGAQGSIAEKSFSVRVYEPFGVSSFTATPPRVRHGEGVTLAWVTTNAASVSLKRDGVELLPPATPSGPGSLSIPNLTENATYVLVATNALGMTAEEVLHVETLLVNLGLEVDETDVRAGTQVDIEIDALPLDGGSIPTVYGTIPMVDVSATSAFLDIATMTGSTAHAITGTTDVGHVDVDFPAGFSFPYYGAAQTGARVFVDGYLSFHEEAVFNNLNQRLPDASPENADVHLAPFWDDLHTRNAGTIWTAAPDANTFVIQWRGMSTFTGSTNTSPSNLNFQIVLHRSGAFEFRYGTMNPSSVTSAGCYPNTCLNEANGSSATIGYQNFDGTSGIGLHFGGTANASTNVPFPGDLANRSFRVEPVVGQGTVTIVPDHSGSYQFCTLSNGQTSCETVDIEVDFQIDAFAASTDTVQVGGSSTLTWTTSGGRELVITANGVELERITDFAIIDAGTLVVMPSENTVYRLELLGGGRRAVASATVNVERVKLSATASSHSVHPGDPVTLTWNLIVADPGVTPVVVTPMAEMDDGFFSEFDLSSDPGATQLFGANAAGSIGTVQFDPGFVFNYLGVERSFVRVSSEGFLSFDSATAVSATNQMIPNDDAAHRRIHIAPFWEDLHTRNSGRVLYKQVDPDTFVVQWSHTSLQYGSSATNEADLNFQVVLRRNGDFEFRYGTMAEPPQPSSSSTDCYPNTCVNEVNGSSATIGFQDPTGTFGHQIHFGGTARAAGQRPVANGLSDRSWKFTAHSTSGAVEVHPSDSTGYQICVYLPADEELLCSDPIEVEAEWGVLSFAATPYAVAPGDPLTLQWEAVGLDSLRIDANGVEIASYARGSIPALGSIPHIPQVKTEYVMTGTSMGRTLVETRIVEMRTFDLDFGLQTPAGRYFPGDTVTLAWNGVPLEAGDFTLMPPLGEVDASSGSVSSFVDVSTLPGATEVPSSAANGFATINVPFSFPYFGGAYTQALAYVDGYLSFDMSGATGVGTNTLLPNGGSTQHRVHLAPFWDDLFIRHDDSFWTYQQDPDTFIIQWKNFNRSTGSVAGGAAYDLNFQVVLFSDGSFEFRYGTMDPIQPPYVNSSCYPNTCVNEANASSATIGYQSPDGSRGSTYHFGGNAAADSNPFAGGLAHRSFRFDPSPTGSVDVTVGSTKSFEVCGFLGDFQECKTVTIRPVANPGDLMITELMLDPTGGASAQWFEVRNLTQEGIDLEGFTLSNEAGVSHVIGASLVVPPGGFVTLAASAAAGITADYLYGNQLTFDPLFDALRLDAGTARIASVAWDGWWKVPAGRTLSLDPSFHMVGGISNDAFDRWCAGTQGGSPGALGTGCSDPIYDLDRSESGSFIDISSTGRRLRQLEADAGLAAVPVSGFSMPFFDGVVDQIWASSNGWISFGATNPAGATTTAPSATGLPRSATAAPGGPIVAAFWDDLRCDPSRACAFYYEQTVVDGRAVTILQWDGFGRGTAAGSLTVQVQLWANGDIVSAFGHVVSHDLPGTTSWNNYHGISAWIGLESWDRTQFLTGWHRSLLDLSHRSFRFLRK